MSDFIDPTTIKWARVADIRPSVATSWPQWIARFVNNSERYTYVIWDSGRLLRALASRDCHNYAIARLPGAGACCFACKDMSDHAEVDNTGRCACGSRVFDKDGELPSPKSQDESADSGKVSGPPIEYDLQAAYQQTARALSAARRAHSALMDVPFHGYTQGTMHDEAFTAARKLLGAVCDKLCLTTMAMEEEDLELRAWAQTSPIDGAPPPKAETM